MTGREAIAGSEAAWASPAALGVCPTCAARGPAHDRERCARQADGRPRSNGGARAPAAGDGLRSVVLAALTERGPFASGNAVVRAVGRRRGAVLAVLRRLELDGLARRNGNGWEAA
jgi:hypothetical protein